MKQDQIKKHIEVEGVILTPELIEYLKELQEDDNNGVKSERETLADIACFLGSNLFMFETDFERIKVSHFISDLAIIRDKFENLRKP